MPDLDHQRIHPDDAIEALQETVLPGVESVEEGICDFRDEFERDVGSVEIDDLIADLSLGESSEEERENLLIETGEAPGVFGHQERFKGSISIAGDLEFKLTLLGAEGLGRGAVARVAGVFTIWRVLLVSEMVGEFGLEGAFSEGMDELKGFPEVWRATFPKAVVQTCVVHLVRNTLELVSWKERKEMAADLRKIYTATTEEQALRGLDAFEERWKSYPTLGAMWRRRWEEVRPFLAYPEEIRKVIYTTNAIESVKSQFRRSVQNWGHFPTERSALKVLYVTVKQMEKKWTKPVHNWGYMFQQFVIHFPDRMPV